MKIANEHKGMRVRLTPSFRRQRALELLLGAMCLATTISLFYMAHLIEKEVYRLRQRIDKLEMNERAREDGHGVYIDGRWSWVKPSGD